MFESNFHKSLQTLQTNFVRSGRMKSSIIASGSEMLLEFVTSPAGPLLNTGFHFKADSIYDSGDAQSIQVNICLYRCLDNKCGKCFLMYEDALSNTSMNCYHKQHPHSHTSH